MSFKERAISQPVSKPHCIRIAIFFAASVSLITVGAAQVPITARSSWAASPNNIVQGKTTDVILTAPAAACGAAAGQLVDASLDIAVNPPTAMVQAGFGVTAARLSHTGNCELTVSLGPATDAKTGPIASRCLWQLGAVL